MDASRLRRLRRAPRAGGAGRVTASALCRVDAVRRARGARSHGSRCHQVLNAVPRHIH